MDIKNPVREGNSPTAAGSSPEPIVAHFVAHTDAIVALQFDYSGMLLATADRRGHDFHVFRVQPHPGGPALASVHHLYVLHRGDTTAKVQDMAFSLDSRWLAVSTLRGTTHVFPVTPYGGSAGVRTHGSPHVVNRLSRFHRSAGLSMDGVRCGSPVNSSGSAGSAGGAAGSLGSTAAGHHGLLHHHHDLHGAAVGHNGTAYGQQSSNAYINPRLPPFPHPTVVTPLAQLRQPAHLPAGLGSGGTGGNGSIAPGSSPGASSSSYGVSVASGRQRLTSLSEETKPLRVSATFARPRAWLLDRPGFARESLGTRMPKRRAMDSLFVMAAHGALIQYDLEPVTSAAVPKDRVCDDTSVELLVEPRAQWTLQRRRDTTGSVEPPLTADNWLLKNRLSSASGTAEVGEANGVAHNGSPEDAQSDGLMASAATAGEERAQQDQWLSQVEIITHAGPHRRLWMGPQFMFKTYNAPSSGPLSLCDLDAVEVGALPNASRPRSNPVNMPMKSNPQAIPDTSLYIGSLSTSGSFEQSPHLRNFDHHMGSDLSINTGDSQLREDLADAMRESPGRHSRDLTDFGGKESLEERHSSTSSLSSTSRASFDAPLSGSPCSAGDPHVFTYHGSGGA